MKLEEIKSLLLSFVACLKKSLLKENELKKELFDLRFQAAAGQLDQTARLNEVKNKLHVLKLCNLKSNNRLGKEQF